MRVLTVECDAALAERWAAAFRRAGHLVRAAHSAREAGLALLSQPFDLLVADLDLGEASGLSVATLAGLRATPCPAILLSGSRAFPNGELFRLCPTLAAVLPRRVRAEELLAVAEYQVARARAPVGPGCGAVPPAALAAPPSA